MMGVLLPLGYVRRSPSSTSLASSRRSRPINAKRPASLPGAGVSLLKSNAGL